MKKLIATLFLVVFSFNSYAYTFQDWVHIYQRIVIANGVFNPPKFYKEADPEVNAESDGNNIHIFSGIIAYARNPDEIALVIGHELAHILLHHTGNSTIPMEYAADHWGAIYMQKAGFNVCHGAQILKKFSPYQDTSDHPAGMKRYHALGCN